MDAKKPSFADSMKAKLGVGKPEEEEKEVEEPEDWPLEDLGHCAAIAKNRWVTALTIRNVGKPWESFQYRYIAARSTFEPTRFEVFFVDDDEKWRVTVTGRNLTRIYNLVIQHRLEWLRAGDRDFDGDDAGYIEAVTVEAVEEKKR